MYIGKIEQGMKSLKIIVERLGWYHGTLGCNYDSLNLEEDNGFRLIPRSLVVVTSGLGPVGELARVSLRRRVPLMEGGSSTSPPDPVHPASTISCTGAPWT